MTSWAEHDDRGDMLAAALRIGAVETLHGCGAVATAIASRGDTSRVELGARVLEALWAEGARRRGEEWR